MKDEPITCLQTSDDSLYMVLASASGNLKLYLLLELKCLYSENIECNSKINIFFFRINIGSQISFKLIDLCLLLECYLTNFH